MTGASDIWAIVPVKPFNEAKRRLASVIGDQERQDLANRFLESTLGVVLEVFPPSRVIIVSRDPAALMMAASVGASALGERGRGLNSALRQATEYCAQAGATAVLAVASDLPFLSKSDLIAMTEAGPVAIAVNRDSSGTNALFLCPPDRIDFAFGHKSFARHCILAGRAGATATIVDREGLSFDLDLPEDLLELRSRDPHDRWSTSALSPAAG